MNDKQRAAFLRDEHIVQKKSLNQIAADQKTYVNKLRRDAKKLGVEIRSKSEAQSVAFAEGRLKHPTKGKKRTEDEKAKISETRALAWRSISPTEKKRLSKLAKKNWENQPAEARERIQAAARKAVREAAKHGSKLEKFLFGELTKAGYNVEYHKEHLIVNEKMHIDLLIPELSVAIEIDGPSHFRPIWGEATLARNKKSDSQKNGLLLGEGFCIIRIRQDKVVSDKFKRDIKKVLLSTLSDISKKKPPIHQRNIEIGA